MWARRCGAPPLWPSRVKVLLQSFVTGAIGVAVWNYMTSADVGYLDLDKPYYSQALCLTEWPLRHDTDNWFAQEWYNDWTAYYTDMSAFVSEHRCTPSVPPTETCSVIEVPLHDMHRNLGIPLGPSSYYKFNNDVLEIYAFIFLFLTVCMWVAVVVHDFTLLSQTYQNGCLDFRGLNRQFRVFQKLYRLSCFSIWRRGCVNSKGVVKALFLLVSPLVFIWGLVVCFCLAAPLVNLLFVRYPVRMGRLQIFVLCFIITILCVSLIIRCSTQLGIEDTRPRYAITWESGGCVCGCVFSLLPSGLWQIILMALGVAYKSVMLGLRCLKGLRRANWANLITVMFAVPLTLYPVEWTKPNGKPIDMRTEGQPVQGEPAFDPFALMDEQKNSAETTCDLRPTHLDTNTSKNRIVKKKRRSRHTAPRIPTEHIREAKIYREEIGCCGFPYLTKASAADLDEDNDDLEFEDDSTVASTQLGASTPLGDQGEESDMDIIPAER